jgi:hypothetical protein
VAHSVLVLEFVRTELAVELHLFNKVFDDAVESWLDFKYPLASIGTSLVALLDAVEAVECITTLRLSDWRFDDVHTDLA